MLPADRDRKLDRLARLTGDSIDVTGELHFGEIGADREPVAMGRSKKAASVADDSRIDAIGWRLPGEGSRWVVGDREPLSLGVLQSQNRIDGRADRDPLDKERIRHVFRGCEAVCETLLRGSERP